MTQKPSPNTQATKPKYWYKIIIEDCPVCGRHDSYRVRMHTERPKNRQDRYSFGTLHCHCSY